MIPWSIRDIDYLIGLDVDPDVELLAPKDQALDRVSVLIKMRQMSILYKTLFERLYIDPIATKHTYRSNSFKEAHLYLKALEWTLYPINEDVFPGGLKQIYDESHGRGLVMSSGTKHFK